MFTVFLGNKPCSWLVSWKILLRKCIYINTVNDQKLAYPLISEIQFLHILTRASVINVAVELFWYFVYN